jgi:hypothetical protein
MEVARTGRSLASADGKERGHHAPPERPLDQAATFAANVLRNFSTFGATTIAQ